MIELIVQVGMLDEKAQPMRPLDRRDLHHLYAASKFPMEFTVAILDLAMPSVPDGRQYFAPRGA